MNHAAMYGFRWLGPIVAGLSLWMAWQFISGAISHPASHLISIFPFLSVYERAPTFAQDGGFAFILYPMYYLTGLTIVLSLGVLAANLCLFASQGLEVGFKEALRQQKIEAAKLRRAEIRDRKHREKKASEQTKKEDAGWSMGAILFGVALGWFLF